MLSIDKTVISMDVLEKEFLCDLDKCRGACCFHGDSGAPLEKDEAEQLEKIWPVIKKTLPDRNIRAVEEKGTSMIDTDGDLVTPLIGDEECAYSVVENGIYRCVIEKEWNKGTIKFRKPLSCHLFPVRIKKYETFDAVNFEEWKLCRPALLKGRKENIKVFRFLREPLIRLYGKKWYSELEIAAREISLRKESRKS